MNEKDSFLGEASFGKEGSFVGSNPTPHTMNLRLDLRLFQLRAVESRRLKIKVRN